MREQGDMKFLDFIQQALANIWVIVGLSLLIVVAGYFLSRLLASWIMRAIRTASRNRLLASRFKVKNAEVVFQRIRQVVRLILFLVSIWVAWMTLDSHPDVAAWLNNAWQALVHFFQLPVVIYTFDILLVVLVTFILVRVIRWVKLAFVKIAARIEAERGKRLRDFHFQRVKLLSANQLTRTLLVGARYVRYALNLLLVLLYLAGIFSIFPQTRGVVTTILNSIFQVIGAGWQDFVDYLPSLFNLVIIVIIARYGLKLIHFFFQEIEKGTITFAGFHRDWAMPTYQLVRILVIALTLVIAFPFLPGSSSPAFQGISIFIGALLSLGSSSVIANIVSGVVLTYTRAFRVGDRVKIADTIGDIMEKTLLVTRIRTIKNVDVTIPNSLVLGSHIINYSSDAKEDGLILNTTVTLGYDIPWRLVHETLIGAALATPDVLPEPRPFVFQTSLDNNYVSYEINAYTDEANRMAVIYSDLHQNIQDYCNQAGIEILSPQFSSLRDGNTSTIPAEHRPKDYRPPSFRVEKVEAKPVTRHKEKTS
jgi:small-conductance mechanosensitive channel